MEIKSGKQWLGLIVLFMIFIGLTVWVTFAIVDPRSYTKGYDNAQVEYIGTLLNFDSIPSNTVVEATVVLRKDSKYYGAGRGFEPAAKYARLKDGWKKIE